MSNMIKS